MTLRRARKTKSNSEATAIKEVVAQIARKPRHKCRASVQEAGVRDPRSGPTRESSEAGKDRRLTDGIPDRDLRASFHALCRLEFRSFCYAAFSIVYPGQVLHPNWHIDIICYRLQLMREGHVDPQLVINIPPRSLKSFIVSICWPAWLLGQDPSLAIVVASYSEELGLKFSRECRRLMASPLYRVLFPGTRLGKSSEGEFETIRNGCRLTASVGGTLTGRGADVLIIDDPLKADDAESDARRDGANDWFRNTAMSRLNQPDDSLVVVVMQRLHEEDLSGLLIEKGWQSLVIPAIATETVEYPTGHDTIHRRAVGAVLQKSGPYSTDYASQRRNLGSRAFSAQYQQDPIPAEGNMIKREWLGHYDQVPTGFVRTVVSVDSASGTSERNDYTAVVVLGVKDHNVYVLHVERGHWVIQEQIRRVVESYRRWRATECLIEMANNGASLAALVKEKGLTVIEINPKHDKKVRLLQNAGQIEMGRLILPREAPWLGDFEKELLAFPSGRHDDQVDTLTQFLEWYRDKAGYDHDVSGATLWVGRRENPLGASFKSMGIGRIAVVPAGDSNY